MKSWKPRPDNLSAKFAWVGNGIGCHTAFTEDCNIFVGCVWIVGTSNSYGESICDIIDIYVPEKFRRAGVAKWLLARLAENYTILRTGYGTKAGGMALMKSMGWKREKSTGDWYLNLPKR